MDRKYSHRGYRDSEKGEKRERSHEKKPPAGGPRGADQFGPRTPRMVGTVTRARCSNCGAVLASGFDSNGKCPKCQNRVFEMPMQYVCEKAVGPGRTCDFRSGKVILICRREFWNYAKRIYCLYANTSQR